MNTSSLSDARTFQSPVKNQLRPFALAVSVMTIALFGCSTSNSTSSNLNSVESDSGFELIVSSVTMRDGVDLYTEILLPNDIPEDGVPTLLLRTPYDLPTLPIGGLAPADSEDSDGDGDGDGDGETEDETNTEDDEELVQTRAAWQPVLDRGYAVVFQNLRGTQSSGGINELFSAEREDGVDAVEWIRTQSWSNGRVGAMGDSAAGFAVHLLAAENPLGLDATFVQVSCGDIWNSAILPDHGGLKLEAFLPFMLGQSLELGAEHLASLSIGEEAIESAEAEVMASLGALFGDDMADQFGAFTKQPLINYPGVSTLLPQWRYVLDESSRGELNSYFDTRGQTTVPGMHVAMWQDIFAECTLGDFQALSTGISEQRLLVLDGSHYEIDDATSWPYLPMLDWFDRHLKDVTGDNTPTVQYAVQSVESIEKPSLQLVGADSWPPLNVDRVYYLDETGGLSETLNDQTFSFSLFSDPLSPQSGFGGRHLVIDAGIAEQAPLTTDNVKLVFTAAINETDLTIAGEVKLDTKISADVADADIHVRLIEVTADGRRVLILEGMQRARFSGNSLTPMDLVPGQVVPLSISLGNIAHKLSAGSRIQIEIAASNFPAWNLNPQVGGSSFTANEYRSGNIDLLSTQDNPFRLIIPTLP